MAEQQPFRFLGLPRELRQHICEDIPISTRHYVLKDPALQQLGVDSKITLIARTLSDSILETCPFIRGECEGIMTRRLAALRSEPILFRIDAPSLLAFVERGGVADLIRQNEKSFDDHGENPPFIAEKYRFGSNSFYYSVQNELHEHWPDAGPMLKTGEKGHVSITADEIEENTKTPIACFIMQCARYMSTRKESKVVIVVNQHEAFEERDLDDAIRNAMRMNGMEFTGDGTNQLFLRKLEIMLLDKFFEGSSEDLANAMEAGLVKLAGYHFLTSNTLNESEELDPTWEEDRAL